MTPMQELVAAMQAKLGVKVHKGQIALNIADGVFQHAEVRVCGLTDVAKPKIVDNARGSAAHLAR